MTGEPTRSTDKEDRIAKGVWGYSKRDWNRYNPHDKQSGDNPLPHYFRNRKCIHQTIDEDGCVRKGTSRLMMPRPNFDPAKPECGKACPECLKILEMEKLDEQAREKSGCKV